MAMQYHNGGSAKSLHLLAPKSRGEPSEKLVKEGREKNGTSFLPLIHQVLGHWNIIILSLSNDLLNHLSISEHICTAPVCAMFCLLYCGLYRDPHTTVTYSSNRWICTEVNMLYRRCRHYEQTRHLKRPGGGWEGNVCFRKVATLCHTCFGDAGLQVTPVTLLTILDPHRTS